MAENPAATILEPATACHSGTEGRETRISPRIIVQGGAYYIVLFGNRHREQMLDEISQAATKGYDILTEDGTAVDAVEEAVRSLENSKYFNAGRGSLFNNDGEIECDALIMDGHTMKTGAVMGARHFSNPVSLSRKIMEESYHCALSGEGALNFAERIGYPTCDPNHLIDEEIKERTRAFTYERYQAFVDNYEGKPVPESEPGSELDSGVENSELDSGVENSELDSGVANSELDSGVENSDHDYQYDSVSAVALDSNGYFACATSTGGIPGKLKGRIGDAALVGCGGYANEHGAAAVGGHGEAIMKMTLAREVVFNIEKGENAQESAKNALQRMKESINGRGRAIAIDRNGILAKETNSTAMLWATMDENELQCGMDSRQESLVDDVEDQV